MGNLFLSACQNQLKSMAKFFRVPSNSSCFPLKISVKSKKKVFTSSDVLFYPANVGEEQKKVFTSSDVLFSPANVGEEQKKIFTRSDVLFSPENSGAPKRVRGSTLFLKQNCRAVLCKN